jgi:hypothetical protein
MNGGEKEENGLTNYKILSNNKYGSNGIEYR